MCIGEGVMAMTHKFLLWTLIQFPENGKFKVGVLDGKPGRSRIATPKG